MTRKMLVAAAAAVLGSAVAVGAAPPARAAGQVSLCTIYPTLCVPYGVPQPVGPFGLPGYPGAQPVYPPGVTTPALGSVVRDTVGALPPGVRQGLYPPAAAAAVRSGAVDAAIGRALGAGVLPYLGAINGYGPGGAGYTNEAALGVLQGTVDPALAACRAMGACR